ncbi:MAG: maiA [Gammaproteobacteria bacterium]|jgi:maleylpyruvate isomerase|nr:maiA [Gammaproteobacteria bacterium]
MKLYTYFRSSAAFRTRIALNLKGIAYESASVDLRAAASAQRKPAFLAINPQGLVPALEHAGTTIAQSLAIIEYLEETYPEPPLLPNSPADRAHVRAMALAIACDMHPLNNLRVLNYLRSPLGQDEESVNSWYRHWIGEGFRGLEEDAKSVSGDRRHMFGTTITLADIYLVPQMYNARRFKCDVAPYPTLLAICAHLEALPAFADAVPEAQPDAQ